MAYILLALVQFQSLCLWALLFALNTNSAAGAFASVIGSSTNKNIRFKRDGDPTGDDQPGDSDDPSDNEGGGKHTGGNSHTGSSTGSNASSTGSNASSTGSRANSTPSATSSGASSTQTSAPSDNNSFHKEGAVGIVFAILALGVITALLVRRWRRRQREKALEAAAAHPEKGRTSNIARNRDLPGLPPSDSASYTGSMTPRPSTVNPSSSSAALMGRNRSSQSQTQMQSHLDDELVRSQTEPSMRTTSYVPTFVPDLPNPFQSDEVPHAQTRAQARAQTLPTIRTQRESEDSQNSYRRAPDGQTILSYPDSSFMTSPTTVSSPHVHRSLTFSSSFAATANGPLQRIPDPPPSPSQWISRSPGGSRRTSTVLEGMVAHQKGLEAEMDDSKQVSGPPPRYSVEEPRQP